MRCVAAHGHAVGKRFGEHGHLAAPTSLEARVRGKEVAVWPSAAGTFLQTMIWHSGGRNE
jgi:hypothetical protein